MTFKSIATVDMEPVGKSRPEAVFWVARGFWRVEVREGDECQDCGALETVGL